MCGFQRERTGKINKYLKQIISHDCVFGKVNVYTHFPLTWSPCVQLRNASSSASHIRVGVGGGGMGKKKHQGGGGREKKISLEGGQTIPIEISHSQAGCSPEAGGFALETAPDAIFGT